MRSWPGQIDTIGFYQQNLARGSSVAVARKSDYSGGSQSEPDRYSRAADNLDRNSSSSIGVERDSSVKTEEIVERASSFS